MGWPVWSADSAFIYFCRSSQLEPRTLIMRKRSNGSGDAEQMAAVTRRSLLKAVEKGETSAIVEYGNGLDTLIARVRFGSSAGPEPLVESTKFRSWEAPLSPDDRWLAYPSNHSGRARGYVKDLGEAGGRWQVSSVNSYEARWSGDGKKLYFRTPVLNEVDVSYTPTFSTGRTGILYDVSKTDCRILMFTPESHRSAPTGVRVVVNWTCELQRQLGNKKNGN
jgi:hypothetical protein